MKLDDLTDLLAAKMTALVERGRPRFPRRPCGVSSRSGNAVGDVGAAGGGEAVLAGAAAGADGPRARLAITTHLARIAQHRPLDQIEDPAKRMEAEEVRGSRWNSLNANLS